MPRGMRDHMKTCHRQPIGRHSYLHSRSLTTRAQGAMRQCACWKLLQGMAQHSLHGSYAVAQTRDTVPQDVADCPHRS